MFKLSIRQKLGLSFTLLLILIIILGGYSLLSLQNVNQKTAAITKTWMPSIVANDIMIDASSNYQIAILQHFLAATPELKSEYENKMKKADDTMQKAAADYKKMIDTAIYSSQAAKEKDLADLQEIEKNWQEIIVAGKQATEFSRANKTAEYQQKLQQVEVAINKLDEEKIRPLSEFNAQGAYKIAGEAEQVYESGKFVMSSIVIIAVLIGLGITVTIIRNIMQAVKSLMQISQAVAAGRLTEKAVVTSSDELGILTESYNNTVDQLRKLIGQIQGTAEQVAASSEELTASADQSAQVTQQIASSITQVSELSMKEITGVEDANVIIEQISAGIEESKATADIMADNAKKTLNAAHEGRETIDGAVNQMVNIEKTVNRSAGVVAKLGERSKEIGQIVDTISGIAGQTNLLALNAAIEAARAGEQGKGFAVVAEEVRKLAEQSQEAAKQIGELIAGIQLDTDNAVLAMDEGTKEVTEGAKVVDQAGKMFASILEMSDSVSQQAGDMTKTMEELATGTQRVVESVENIKYSSKNVAAESQSVSAATEEQSAAMEQIASSSRSLADLAQDLQKACNQFTV